MNGKKLMDAIGSINNKYIEEAANFNAAQAKRKNLIRIAAIAACLCLFLSALLAAMHLLPPQAPSGSTHSSPIIDAVQSGDSCDSDDTDDTKVHYVALTNETAEFDTAEELTVAGNLIVLAKLKNISFSLSNDGKDYKTYYDVEVLRCYKGNSPKNLRFAVSGGVKDMYVSEQLKVLGEYADEGIPVYEDLPVMSIGETYLLVLNQNGNRIPQLLSISQGVYKADTEPTVSEEDYGIQSILTCLGGNAWEEYESGDYIYKPVFNGAELEYVNYYYVGDCFVSNASSYSSESTLEYKVSSVRYYNNVNMVDRDKLEAAYTDDVYIAHMEIIEEYRNDKENRLEKTELLYEEKLNTLINEDGTLKDDYVFVLIDVTVTNLSASGNGQTASNANMHYHQGEIRVKFFPVYEERQMYSDCGTVYHYLAAVDGNGNEIDKAEVEASYWSLSDGTRNYDRFYLEESESITWQEGVIVKREYVQKYGLCRTLKNLENDSDYTYGIVDLAR